MSILNCKLQGKANVANLTDFGLKFVTDHDRTQNDTTFISHEKLERIIQWKKSSITQESTFNIHLYDLRDFKNYQDGHIEFSKPMNCTKKLMLKKSLMDLKRYLANNSKLSDVFIFYNDSGVDFPDDFMKFIGEFRREWKMYLLSGGFARFKEEFGDKYLIKSQDLPLSPTNPDFVSQDIFNHPMSKIFDYLYIGNQQDSENLEMLRSNGITDIICLNVCSHINPAIYAAADINLKMIDASDNFNQDLMQFFSTTNSIIDDIRSRDGKVLIHCKAGVSRSVTIAMAYILYCNSCMPVLDALQLIQQNRSIACPNLNFLGQLERYRQSIIIT